MTIVASGIGLFQGYNAEIPPPKIDNPNHKISLFEKRWFRKLFPDFISLVGGIGLAINLFNSTYRLWPQINAIFLTLFLGGITTARMVKDIQANGFLLYYKAICFFLVGFLFYMYGKNLAAITFKLGNETNISFLIHNKKVLTNQSYIFLGESQSTIFIFNKKDTTTLIFPKSSIDSLVIKSTKLIKNPF